jgi:hypothetical protein
VEQHDEQISHLNRLADELTRSEFVAHLVGTGSRPYLRVASQEVAQLSERIFCGRAADGSWCFWWPWRQPIGSVDDLRIVARKIMTVLRPVEGLR